MIAALEFILTIAIGLMKLKPEFAVHVMIIIMVDAIAAEMFIVWTVCIMMMILVVGYVLAVGNRTKTCKF